MGGPMGHKPIDINTGMDTETHDAYKKVSTILGMLMSENKVQEHTHNNMLGKETEHSMHRTELTRLIESKRF